MNTMQPIGPTLPMRPMDPDEAQEAHVPMFAHVVHESHESSSGSMAPMASDRIGSHAIWVHFGSMFGPVGGHLWGANGAMLTTEITF